MGINFEEVFSFHRPRGELSPASVEATLEGVRASLHREAGGVVWLRVAYEGRLLFETLESALMTGRTKDQGPFFLVGSWGELSGQVRQVRVEHGGRQLEPPSSEDGWLCLFPSNARGYARVVWLDDEGEERESTGHDGPPLEDAGTLGPTFYAPLT